MKSRNIVNLIAEIDRQVPASWDREILLVDDKSSDGTYAAVKAAYGGNERVKAILRQSDRGLARSIRTGLEHATGDYLLVMDTDFTHRPDEIPLMLHLAVKVDLVSGSRFCAGGRMDDTAHYLASFVYNLLIRVLIRTQIQDNLGGFWVARADVIRALPWDRIFYGYGDYYFRLLHYLQRNRRTIVELPSRYSERAAGKSKSNFMKLLLDYSARVLELAIKRKDPRH